MPIYSWECPECKKEAETIASMSESDTPPEEKSDEKCASHKWIKVIRHAPTKAYAAGWGVQNRKGNYNSGGGFNW